MANDSFPLNGLHAVVTGGSRGIGAAIASQLAGAGASVSILGRDAERLSARAEAIATEHKRPTHAVPADVTDPDAVAGAFAEVRARVGDADVLVNNAGAVETAPLERTDGEMWERMIAVNLTSAYLCSREVLAAMRHAGRGRIINIASTAGLMGYPYVAAYTAAKHGVIGLTRSIALELEGTGVTVNAVCPGYTDTDLVGRAAEAISEKTGQPVEDIVAQFARANPSGRLVAPDEVAQKVLWLCLPSQSGLNGEAIVVDGAGTE